MSVQNIHFWDGVVPVVWQTILIPIHVQHSKLIVIIYMEKFDFEQNVDVHTF